MMAYVVVTEFAAPQVGRRLLVGDTVGKIGGRISCLIGGIEYTSQAFYDWVGSADSLNFLSFTGALPDPVAPTGALVVGGIFPIPNGQDYVTVTGAAFGYVPSSVVATVLKPVGGDNLIATVRVPTITADGFTADLQAPAGAGYFISYAGVQ